MSTSQRQSSYVFGLFSLLVQSALTRLLPFFHPEASDFPPFQKLHLYDFPLLFSARDLLRFLSFAYPLFLIIFSLILFEQS